jgi:hypothetical protein
MSHFLERLTYLTRRRETFADGLCELRDDRVEASMLAKHVILELEARS